MGKNVYKCALALLIIASLALFFFGDTAEYFSFSFIAEHRNIALAYVGEHWVLSILVFCVVYITLTAISFPAAAALTIVAGALFGLGFGTLAASISSTIGATIAMLVTRFLVSDSTLERRFSDSLEKIRGIVARNAMTSLLTLRLAPVFPFFLVNMAMGLTNIRVIQYVVASMLGMLPGTILYVYVGSQIATISSPKDVVSFEILAGLAALALFPFVMKYLAVKFKWYTGEHGQTHSRTGIREEEVSHNDGG